MSTSQRIGSTAFVLLTRLFAGLKRSGRVIDVIWFQKNAEYARAVLALADEDDDEAVRKLGAELRALLGDFLAVASPPPSAPSPTATGRVAAVSASPPPAATATVAAEAGEPLDRYVGRLR